MTLSYSWLLPPSVKTASSVGPLQDVVLGTHWTYRAVDGEYAEEESGFCVFDAPQADSFVAFGSITASVLTSWLESTLDIAAMQKRMSDKIATKQMPSVTFKSLAVAPPTNDMPAAPAEPAPTP